MIGEGIDETIRLYCAQADASNIVSACLKYVKNSVTALSLAIDCMEEAAIIHPKVRQLYEMVIIQGVDSRDKERRKIVSQARLSSRLRKLTPLENGLEIDSSLVTCAEYQLFIDWYTDFIPPHWRNNSFELGKGNTPILGIRAIDAVAFCDWLTRREVGEWHYRLPTIDETTQHEIISKQKYGYWVEDDGKYLLMGISLEEWNAVTIKAIENLLMAESSFSYRYRNSEIIRKAIINRLSQRTPQIDLDRILSSATKLNKLRKEAGVSNLALDYGIKEALNRTSPNRLNVISMVCDSLIRTYFQLNTKDQKDQKNSLLVLDAFIDLMILELRIRGHLLPPEGIRILREPKEVGSG